MGLWALGPMKHEQKQSQPSKPPARDSGVSPKTQKVLTAAARASDEDDAVDFDFNPRRKGRSFMHHGEFLEGLKNGNIENATFMPTLSQYVKDFAAHAAHNMDEDKIFNRFVITVANVGMYNMLSSGMSEEEVKKIIALCFQRASVASKIEFAASIEKKAWKDSKK